MKKEQAGKIPEAYKQYVSLVAYKSLTEALQATMNPGNYIHTAILQALGNKTYAPGKWTIKEILQHIIDTERVFNYRALRFSRKDKTPLAGFEHDEYVMNSAAEAKNISSLLQDFESSRRSTISLFHSFTDEMLMETGIASGKQLSVAAIGFTIAGHFLHHMNIIRQKYIPLLRGSEAISIEDYRREWKEYFSHLNKAWIIKYFQLEPFDKYVLENPREAILDQGGKVYFALFEEIVIGAVALLKRGDSVFELTKMAVDDRFRGLGAGELLCRTAIQKADELRATKLILYTNSQLRQAINIYKKLGFREVALEQGIYDRADVKMELSLNE